MSESLKARYDARMKPAGKKRVKREFKEFLEDMGYDSEKAKGIASDIVRTYMFEAFVGGWGARTRDIKRRERRRKKNVEGQS